MQVNDYFKATRVSNSLVNYGKAVATNISQGTYS